MKCHLDLLEDVINQIDEIAEQNHRSRNGQINFILAEYIKDHERNNTLERIERKLDILLELEREKKPAREGGK